MQLLDRIFSVGFACWHRCVPSALRRSVREQVQRLLPEPVVPAPHYCRLYEAHARMLPPERSVGAGDFDIMGRVELAILRAEGLRPTDTLIDMGCGAGRLSRHAIPYLHQGRYIGTEISETMLRHARERMREELPEPAAEVSWVLQPPDRFPCLDASADVVCAFSVFTHMEPGDTYRCLVDGLRTTRPGGIFVFSCLPVEELQHARDVFRISAGSSFEQRWQLVRDFVTSVTFMSAIAELAGWRVRRWYRGEEKNVQVDGLAGTYALGQSTCVLERPVQ